jgi:hypothetical protein
VDDALVGWYKNVETHRHSIVSVGATNDANLLVIRDEGAIGDYGSFGWVPRTDEEVEMQRYRTRLPNAFLPSSKEGMVTSPCYYFWPRTFVTWPSTIGTLILYSEPNHDT